jgi:hypothetical protein
MIMWYGKTLVGFAAMLVLSLAGSVNGAITIVNDDFSNGLNGWTVFGPVVDGGGFARLYDDHMSFQGTLEQGFVVPVGAQSLSFSYVLSLTPDATSGSFLPDAFTASLLDPASNPILSTPGYTDYFYHDDGGTVDFDPGIVSKSGNTVTLDLSSVPAGTNARIVFDLYMGDDGWTTQADVHYVGVEPEQSAVPEPISAVVWAVLGIGLYVARRRLVA